MNRPYEHVEGWIELGAFAEAAEALHNLPPHLKSSMDFLQLWVLVYGGLKAWGPAEQTCDTILAHQPESEFALLHKAEAMHRQGRSAEAILFTERFPKALRFDPVTLYSLARYLCANGQREDALNILEMAFDKDKKLRLKALSDPELERVWRAGR